VTDFLNENPTYNGTNVRIGILDTGVDPNAVGIRWMVDGVTPKLMDLVDATGSGDVDVSYETKATLLPLDVDDKSSGSSSAWQVQGLSGRTLILSKEWKICPFPPVTCTNSSLATTNESTSASKDDKDNEAAAPTVPPTVAVRLGLKRAYELFPSSLTARVKAHRKTHLDKQLHRHVADVRSQLADWNISLAAAAGEEKLTPAQIRQRDDLQALLDVLQDKQEWDTSNDPGMLLDCVVFWDGTDYRTVICPTDDTATTTTTTTTKGSDLRQIVPMTSFGKERQFSTISTLDQYNYGVQFYENGTILSIVGDITPHGTHVAGIAAGAEGSDRSGMAPGAELVSIKIGDSRMGSMESGAAMARGIMEAVRLKCHLINLSYGEGCQLPNQGRIIQFAEELVWRHNILFVSAVGNNGPALTTVNAPGGMSSSILGVAAYVSPDMMKAEYSMSSNTNGTTTTEPTTTDEELVGTTYTWSSVGPAADGSNGVCLCAPGGAVTSVSNWTMQKSMLMNGTSMASPSACGCVALLLSACKAEGIPISSSRIQRALENTAKPMANISCLQQGWGMIQVDKAFEHLKACKDYESEDVHFEVTVDSLTGSPRGIYLRQADEASVKQTFAIKINPNFRRVDDNDDDKIKGESQRSQINFEMQFSVTSTEKSWVSAPNHFFLMNNGRSFNISVDPTKLPPGVHTAKICGSDAEHPERGVIWSLPITVVKPMEEKRLLNLGELEVRNHCVRVQVFAKPCLFSLCLTLFPPCVLVLVSSNPQKSNVSL
jgi:tripeptidyl-peptidase-2